MDFAHIHASLRFDVSDAAERADLDFYRDRADLISCTETGARSDAGVLFRDVEGWDFYRPRGGAGKRQNSITWKTDVFERAGKPRAELLSKTRWHRVARLGGRLTPYLWATVVPLRHTATGREVFVVGAHLPSSIQAGSGWKDGVPNRTAAARECLESLGALSDRLRHEHPNAAIIVAADWNLDLKNSWVRKTIGSALPSLRLSWDVLGRLPKSGSHHRRLIDSAFTRGLDVEGGWVMKKRSSDHRGVRMKFSFVEQREQHGDETKALHGPRIDKARGLIEDALGWAEKHDAKKARFERKALEALDGDEPDEEPAPEKKPRPWLNVLSANVYVANKRLKDDLALFERLSPDAIGVQEGYRLPKMEPFGFRRFSDWRDKRFSAEVPVLVRRTSKISVRDHQTIQGAKGIPDTKVAHPRWITVVRLTKRGRRVAIINTHLHAAIQNKRGGVYFGARRVAQYREHMKTLLQVIEAERAAGWDPVVTGDMNYRLKGSVRKVSQTWKWSPHKALKRAGLTYRAFGLDGVAFDPEVFEERKPAKKVRSKGSDHDYVLARLRWK